MNLTFEGTVNNPMAQIGCYKHSDTDISEHLDQSEKRVYFNLWQGKSNLMSAYSKRPICKKGECFEMITTNFRVQKYYYCFYQPAQQTF